MRGATAHRACRLIRSQQCAQCRSGRWHRHKPQATPPHVTKSKKHLTLGLRRCEFSRDTWTCNFARAGTRVFLSRAHRPRHLAAREARSPPAASRGASGARGRASRAPRHAHARTSSHRVKWLRATPWKSHRLRPPRCAARSARLRRKCRGGRPRGGRPPADRLAPPRRLGRRGESRGR